MAPLSFRSLSSSLALLLTAAPLPAGAPPAQGPRPPSVDLGMNMAGFEYTGNKGSTELPFVDLVKACKPFEAVLAGQSYPTGASVRPYREVFTAVDPNGYPVEAVPKDGYHLATQLASATAGHYPAGDYVVRFQGVGDLSFGGDVVETVRLGPQRYRITVAPTNRGIFLRVTSSPGGPARVKNLRVVQVELADAAGDPVQTFQPLFLERLHDLQPKALRFVYWKGVTSLTVQRLEDEAAESHYNYQRANRAGGVPWSILTELCQEVGADLWANLPYDADLDAYVQPLAAQLASWSAATGLKVRVEYGNEVWNPTFQGQFCYGLDQVMGCADCDVEVPNLTPGIQECTAVFYATRSREVFQRFEGEFDALGVRDRLVRVVGGRVNRWDYTAQILRSLGGPDRVDVVALNAFFGSQLIKNKGWDWALAASEQDLAEYLRGVIDGPQNSTLFRFFVSQQATVDLYDRFLGDDVVLNAYEGGQSLRFDQCDCPGFCSPGGNPACVDLIWFLSTKFNDMNRSPVMVDLYWAMFERWQQVTGKGGSGTLFLPFNFIRDFRVAGQGSWGALEYLDSPVSTAWKFQAIRDAQSP